jgi:hypothetical protein
LAWAKTPSRNGGLLFDLDPFGGHAGDGHDALVDNPLVVADELQFIVLAVGRHRDVEAEGLTFDGLDAGDRLRGGLDGSCFLSVPCLVPSCFPGALACLGCQISLNFYDLASRGGLYSPLNRPLGARK